MRRLKLTFLTSLIILILVFFLGLLSLQLRNKKNGGSKSDISGNKIEDTKAEDVDAFYSVIIYNRRYFLLIHIQDRVTRFPK